MQVEFKKESMLLIPVSQQEKQGLMELFPPEHHQLSKRVRTKNFVDKFGYEMEDFYVEVKGFKGKKETE